MKKRLLAALLTSALALSLTACGGGTDSSAADGGDTASTHDGPYKDQHGAQDQRCRVLEHCSGRR